VNPAKSGSQPSRRPSRIGPSCRPGARGVRTRRRPDRPDSIPRGLPVLQVRRAPRSTSRPRRTAFPQPGRGACSRRGPPGRETSRCAETDAGATWLRGRVGPGRRSGLDAASPFLLHRIKVVAGARASPFADLLLGGALVAVGSIGRRLRPRRPPRLFFVWTSRGGLWGMSRHVDSLPGWYRSRRASSMPAVTAPESDLRQAKPGRRKRPKTALSGAGRGGLALAQLGAGGHTC
jgi:hypothetical protein